MVVIAAFWVGAGGLGVPGGASLNSVQVGMGFGSGFTHRAARHHLGPHQQTKRTRGVPMMNSAWNSKTSTSWFANRDGTDAK